MFETRPLRSLRMEPLLKEVLFLIGPPDSNLRPDLPVSFAQVAALKLFLPRSSKNGAEPMALDQAGAILMTATAAW